MIIWKPLVGEYLQCVKEPTNTEDKNPVAVVHTNSHYKKGWLAICNTYPCFYPCPNCTLDAFATGKRVNHNHGGEYGLEMPANFLFYGPQKANKLAKN